MKELSIIIPCYNVEKYIDQCVASLIGQTLPKEELELIFVDDASSDATIEHLKKWESQYEDSILIISCDQNGKQGTARNIGMQYAQGRYIGFVDSDDWVEKEMFESLLNKAREMDCDMVSCHAYRNREDGRQIPEALEHTDQWIQREKSAMEGGAWPEEFFGSVWSRIYKRELLLENNIRFPEGLCYEDNYFTTVAALYCKSIYKIEKCLYHYRENASSTTLSRNNLRLFDRLEIERMKLEKFRELQLSERFYPQIRQQFFELYYFNTMYMMAERFDAPPYEVFQKMQEQISESFPDYREQREQLAAGNPVRSMLLKVLDCHFTEEQFLDFMQKYAALPKL